MPEQLSILGLWERVDPTADEAPTAPLPPVPLPVADPRQEELLSGAHALRSQIEAACIALDAVTMRAAHVQLINQFTRQSWAEHVPAWAEGIIWLTEPSRADELARRALSISHDAQLPGSPRFLFESVRATALKRAAQRLIDERGVTAVLGDGRPAGYLALLAGDFALACELLEKACTAVENSNAQWLGYRGEAAWRRGETFAAMQSYGRASLVDPGAIDQEVLTCQPVLELLDLSDELELSDSPLTYLAVLADLAGKHPIEELAVPPLAPPAVRLAGLLWAFRRSRAAGVLDEAGRIAAKREMLRLAPGGLRELLRRL